MQQRLLILRVQMLHRNLRSVDTELARLMPGTYGGLPEYETPSSSLPGRPASNPPPVPEGGTPHALDLAFERIQLLQQLTQAGESVASTRIAGVSPDVVASFVSLSLPVLIHAPHHDSHTSTVLLAIGLLTGGVLLAGAAFWLGRRGRRPQAS